MPEWLIGAVLKTVEHASVPWVRIPLPPIFSSLIGTFLLVEIQITPLFVTCNVAKNTAHERNQKAGKIF